MDATAEMVKVEVWVMVGSDGQYSAHTDSDELLGRFDDECDGGVLARRTIKVTLNVPVPVAVELEATVAAEPSTGELKTV